SFLYRQKAKVRRRDAAVVSAALGRLLKPRHREPTFFAKIKRYYRELASCPCGCFSAHTLLGTTLYELSSRINRSGKPFSEKAAMSGHGSARNLRRLGDR